MRREIKLALLDADAGTTGAEIVAQLRRSASLTG